MSPDTLNSEEDYNRPVAYDTQGQPLYTHPSESPRPQVVYATHPIEPIKQEVSPEVKARHDKSVRDYPGLNLSEEEYIICSIGRHPIGIINPLAIGTIFIAVMLSVLFNYDFFIKQFEFTGFFADRFIMSLIILFIILIIAVATYIPYYVYTNNKIFLTNESVIQEIQLSLFSHHEQTISLENVEDVGYQKSGVAQQLFDFGSIQLSTVGEETTYRLTDVANPKKQIAILNNAVESFKNGRPIDVEDD